MNFTAMLCLKLIRDCTVRHEFSKGYVIGYVNGKKYDFEPWERQYIENVMNQIMWKGGRA